jgi:hypothetical protein
LTKRAVSSDVTTKEFGKKIDGQEFEAVDDVGGMSRQDSPARDLERDKYLALYKSAK